MFTRSKLVSLLKTQLTAIPAVHLARIGALALGAASATACTQPVNGYFGKQPQQPAAAPAPQVAKVPAAAAEPTPSPEPTITLPPITDEPTPIETRPVVIPTPTFSVGPTASPVPLVTPEPTIELPPISDEPAPVEPRPIPRPTPTYVVGPKVSPIPLKTPAPCYTDAAHFQPKEMVSKSLDILFVVDTSLSLNASRVKIAKQLGGYDTYKIDRRTGRKVVAGHVAGFMDVIPDDVDYRIGVMLGHGSLSERSGRLFSRDQNNLVLDSKKLNREEIKSKLYDDLIRLKTDTNFNYNHDAGGEELFYSLWHSMDPDRLAEMKSEGFFRGGAALATVFISGESDTCTPVKAHVRNRANHLKGQDSEDDEIAAFERDCTQDGIRIDAASLLARLRQMKNQDKPQDVEGEMPILAASIVHDDLAKVARIPDLNEKYGDGFIDLARLTGGNTIDIDTPSYNEGLKTVAELLVKSLHLMSDFTLEHPERIDPETLHVYLDGQELSSDERVWDQLQKKLRLKKTGHAESKIEISYCEKDED